MTFVGKVVLELSIRPKESREGSMTVEVFSEEICGSLERNPRCWFPSFLNKFVSPCESRNLKQKTREIGERIESNLTTVHIFQMGWFQITN